MRNNIRRYLPVRLQIYKSDLQKGPLTPGGTLEEYETVLENIIDSAFFKNKAFANLYVAGLALAIHGISIPCGLEMIAPWGKTKGLTAWLEVGCLGEENIGNIGWTTLNNRHEIPKAIHRVFGKIVVRIQEGDAIGL